ncbi:hypothetical protein MAL1_00182 [Bacteriophage DSS3_MAL1]|nr:hypothetical protein MAL1_00182 [Bacteriophage DSS3_MAL1]
MERIAITTTDYGPLGNITGNPQHDGYCVTATTEAGEVYMHRRADLDEADAKNLAKVVGLAGKITPEHWSYWRTVYGSAAFQAEETEAAHAAQMIRDGYAQEADFAGTPVGELL